MNDEDVKTAIVSKRWRIWYAPKQFSIDKWVVQRRTWYGGWRTIGRFYTEREALSAKQVLIREDVGTFRGRLKEMK